MMMTSNAQEMVGQSVDAAAFAAVHTWRGAGRELEVHPVEPDADGLLHPCVDPQTGEWHIGLEWERPRDVQRVVVRFAEDTRPPDDLQVQYWRNNWPTPAPERWPGARRGWIGQDDPWNGHWVTVKAEVRHEDDRTAVFVFDPVDLPELRAGLERTMAALPSAVSHGLRYQAQMISRALEEAEHYLARFRRTLKLRLVGTGDAPALAGLEAYTASIWREEAVEVWFQGPGDWDGTVEVVNGYLLDMGGLDFGPRDGLSGEAGWSCHVERESKGVRLRVLSADCAPDSADRTIVTVRTIQRSFSFLLADLEGGPIYIRDYGVFVKRADDLVSFEAFKERIAASPKPIYDRVPDEPEHSYERAAREIPPLDVTKQAPFGRYVPLGVEAGRQELALRYNGELFSVKSLLKLRGRDAAHLLWPGDEIHYRFPTGDPPDFREAGGATRQRVLEGWLPVVTSEWLDREIEYQQTAFAALLDGPMTPQWERRGDEDVVVLLRFDIRNATGGAKRARLWLSIAPQEALEVRVVGEGAEAVVARGRVVPDVPVARQWRVDLYEGEYLRCTVDTQGRGELSALPLPVEGGTQAIPTAVAYDVELEGGEAHTIYMAVPFVTFTREEEWEKVAGLDFGEKLADVVSYWKGYVGSGGQIELPDAILNDLHKAVQTHVAISVDKDPGSGMYMVPAATYAYGVCANEACWQIEMLDQAGHHDRAEAYLETYLDTQGASRLDGAFRSAEGTLLGLEVEDGKVVISHFNYNLDHGFVMECLARHYRYTGDKEWLRRVAPNLVAACDMVIREREATKRVDSSGRRVPEYGLLPAGHLEDNPEWRHWFAVNAHAYGGMKAISEVLAEIDHPEAERLAREAAAYREDIRQAARRAMVEAPVVRLLDGTCVPHVPTRTGIRGREWGWFREAAYGALHLLEGGVFEPDEEEMTWVLKDLEDNLFVSREWGRPVDLERYWFSHGGITIQPNLMDLAIDYLRRGEIQHAIRALYNNFGVSVYPDVRCFTEHPVIELGHGVGPFYKSSDEGKALVWLRAFLLHEEGETLYLGLGAPRAWFAPGQTFGVQRMASFFGPVTYRVEAAEADVAVTIDLGGDRPPGELIVHLRRPGRPAMQRVTVNGVAHTDFDPDEEIVRIAAPSGVLTVRAEYAGESAGA